MPKMVLIAQLIENKADCYENYMANSPMHIICVHLVGGQRLLEAPKTQRVICSSCAVGLIK